MHTNVPTVPLDATFREVVTEITKGCQGLVVVFDADTKTLQGIITDGDLRRAMEKRDDFVNCSAAELMTVNPMLVESDTKVHDAENMMTEKRISSLIVSDDGKSVAGLIRIFSINAQKWFRSTEKRPLRPFFCAK